MITQTPICELVIDSKFIKSLVELHWILTTVRSLVHMIRIQDGIGLTIVIDDSSD